MDIKKELRPLVKKISCMILILIFACIGCGKKRDTLVVASKPHAEQYILAEMITLLIEVHTDIKVEQKLGIGGGTSNIHPAMEKGEIDIYPEYTGTGWLFVLKENLMDDSEKMYDETKRKYLENYNIHWLNLYGFNNTYGLALKKSLAEELGIKTYSDLANKSGDLIFGAEYDFYEREDGYTGLSKAYDFEFKDAVELDIGLKYDAIESNNVDVINVFSTDGLLSKYNFQILEDDRHYFPAYQGATLVRGEVLEKHPKLEDLLNQLGGKIDDKVMIELNYKVEGENEDPREVAKAFLIENGLIQE